MRKINGFVKFFNEHEFVIVGTMIAAMLLHKIDVVYKHSLDPKNY